MSICILISTIVISSIIVLISKHAVHSVLYLVRVFVHASIIRRILQADFMALIRLVVYVGAIAILFRFVVIMLNLAGGEEKIYDKINVWLISITLIFWIYLISDSILSYGNELSMSYISWVYLLDNISGIKLIGHMLYVYGIVYLLSVGIVLRIAIIGSVGLTRQVRAFAIPKRQVVYQQVSRISDNI